MLGTGWGISADIDESKLEAAWTLVKWLVGLEVQSFRLSTGGISTPSHTGVDFNTLDLEPIQMTASKLAEKYDIATVVIDGSFEDAVYIPLNDGLQAIGLGTQSPELVAGLVQSALEAWKATQ